MKNNYSKSDIFLEYEEKNHLNSNYPGWTFLRIYIQSYLFRDNYTNLFVNKKGKQKNNQIKIILKKLKYILYIFISFVIYPFRPEKDEIFLFLPFDRKEDGYYPCKFTYKSYQYYYEKSIVFDFNINCNISQILKNKNSIRLYLYLIKKKIFRKKELNNLINNEIDIVIKYVEKVIKLLGHQNTKNNQLFTEFCRKKLYQFYKLKETYKDIYSILVKCNTKKIFEVASTYPLHMIINYFTFNTTIRTLEFQHGLISSDIGPHVFSEKKIKCYPQYLFTFGKKWSTSIRYPIPAENVISIGLAFYNEKKKENKCSPSNQKCILCISDLNIHKEMKTVINNILKYYDDKYKIVIKLHPVEESIYEDLGKEAKIEIVKNINIYSLFSNSSIIIGGTSTALFEGYGFGLPTIIINKDNYTTGYLNLLLDLPNVYNSKENNIIEILENLESTSVLHENSTMDLWEVLDDLEIKERINKIS